MANTIHIDNMRAIEGDYGPDWEGNFDDLTAWTLQHGDAQTLQAINVDSDAVDVVAETRRAFERMIEGVSRALYGSGFNRESVMGAGLDGGDPVTVQMASHIAYQRGPIVDLGESLRAADQALRAADTAMRALLNESIAQAAEDMTRKASA